MNAQQASEGIQGIQNCKFQHKEDHENVGSKKMAS
jgi:hypothetical protein